jgi:hypothetical protein
MASWVGIRRLFMNCNEESGEHIEHILRLLDARCSEDTGVDVKVTVEIRPNMLYELSNLTLLNHLMHSTRVLKVLVLRCIRVNEEVSRLMCNGLALNQSVTELSLINCFFFDEASLEFIDFVQRKVNRGTNNLKILTLGS